MSRRRSRIPGTRRERTLFVLPSIPDALDEQLKDALAIRNACTVDGRCPSCGTSGVVHADTRDARLLHIVFEHEAHCGALTDEALS